MTAWSLSLSGPAAHTPLVYAFGSFHPRYYTMRYDTPDATALAHRVARTMPNGEPVHQHAGRGLDHGAWVPLMATYPWPRRVWRTQPNVRDNSAACPFVG